VHVLEHSFLLTIPLATALALAGCGGGEEAVSPPTDGLPDAGRPVLEPDAGAGFPLSGAACVADAECDDGEACNGSEACVLGYCASPSACEVSRCAVDHGGCAPAATCSDGPAGPICQCRPGFGGNGKTCVARWTLVDTLTVPPVGIAGLQHSGTLGSRIFFANDNAATQGPNQEPVFMSYDAVSRELLPETPRPEALGGGYGATLIGWSDRVYVFATSGHSYHPSGKAWMSTRFDASRPRAGTATALLDGRIYRVGGRAYVDTVDAYDPTTDSWSTEDSIASYPWKVANAVAAAHDGKLYVMGGVTAAKEYGKFGVYDPHANAWRAKPEISLQTSYARSAVEARGKIYLDVISELRVYDPAADTWQEPIKLPVSAKDAPGVVTANGDLYAVTAIDTTARVFRLEQ
jgi:hypothetical protein